MCVICYKPASVSFPDRATLENCFYNNPDGAGYAVWRNGDNFVTYRKGFFLFDDLYNALMDENIQKEDIVAVHFRIATHGKVNAKNCHPFCVTDDKELVSSTEGFCKSVVIHNGILGKKYSSDKNVSDTLSFTMALAKQESKLINDGTIESFIKKETEGSRILYLNAYDNKVIMTGNWIYDKQTKCYFSNYSFEIYDGFSSYYSGKYAPLYPICPQCGGFVKHISTLNDLWECEHCGALCDSDGVELELYSVDSSLDNLYKGSYDV